MEAMKDGQVLEGVANTSFTVHSILMIVCISTFLIWYAQFRWKRRKLYKMAAQRPGPFALPLLGNALYFAGSASDILKSVNKILSEYESPVRIWLGEKLYFGISDLDNLEIVLNSPNVLDKDYTYKFMEPALGTGLITAPAHKWKRHRKIIMPTFNQKILDQYVEIFSEQSQILLEQMQHQVGKGIFNVFDYVSRCTLDLICETAMGVKVSAQTTDSEFSKWTSTAMAVVRHRLFHIWYHLDFIFNMTSMAKDFNYAITAGKNFSAAVVKEKRQAYQRKVKERQSRQEPLIVEGKPRTRQSFLQQLIEISENGANFTDEELQEEVVTFMVAGTDTTAGIDSFVLIILGMYPQIQKRVYEEIIDVLGPDRVVEYKDLSSLQYTERVIKETLRLFPIAPMLARTVTDDIKLPKCILPAGSSVMLSIFYIQRDAKLWPDPLKFDPDRFLPEEIAKRHPLSWIPFSGGLRHCPGLKYGMMAMKTVVATIVRNYRITTDYKSIEDIELEMDLVLKPVRGYRIGIELRESVTSEKL